MKVKILETGKIIEIDKKDLKFRHRLMCGSSTEVEDVEKLTEQNKVDFCFTDPPYNLGYSYNSYEDDKGYNEYRDFCREWFDRIKDLTSQIIITPGKQNLTLWLKDIEIPTDIAIWIAKNKMSGGKISNLSLWEPLLYYGKFDRNIRPTDIYEYNNKFQEDVGKNHTCPKQLPMIAEIIQNYSKENVYDCFGGSGTTLIACEQLNRKCYMMELDEKYCEVICQRWEKLTGKQREVITNAQEIAC